MTKVRETVCRHDHGAGGNVKQHTDRFVAFEHVQKSYDGQTLVVRDLNLDIAKGEFLTMLGPSGSGKTTTLMMLAGFETATGGEILLDGRQINLVPPHKRGIGRSEERRVGKECRPGWRQRL